MDLFFDTFPGYGTFLHGPNDGQRRTFPYLRRMDDGRPVILLQESAARWRTTRGGLPR